MSIRLQTFIKVFISLSLEISLACIKHMKKVLRIGWPWCGLFSAEPPNSHILNLARNVIDTHLLVISNEYVNAQFKI